MIVTSFGSSGLSSVFVFGFSKSFWLMEEKFSILQKYNEKRKRKSVWLFGLNVKSILNFDVLVVWEVDSLDLFRFSFVLTWNFRPKHVRLFFSLFSLIWGDCILWACGENTRAPLVFPHIFSSK